MNVLIVEDEPVMRAILRKVLTRELECQVTEATDGLEGLNAISDRPFAFVVTDLHMPNMDGIELLEAIRQSPERGATPVVLMTSDRDQRVVQKAIALGVSDYLTKPLDPARVAVRLHALLDKLRQQGAAAEAAHAEASSAEPSAKYIIADGSADFRQFFVSLMGPGRAVHQAETGVAALQRAAEIKPDAVFVGSNLGLLEPGLFSRKVRSMRALDGVRLYAIVPRALQDSNERFEAFDDVLVRSFDLELFRQQITRVIGQAVPPGGILASLFRLCEDLTAAAEQAFGMILGMEIRTAIERVALPVSEAIEVVQTIELAGAGERLQLSMRADRDAARQMAAAMQRVDPERLPSDDPGRSMTEMIGIVTERLKTTLEAAGFRVTCHAPTIRPLTGNDMSGPAGGGLFVTGRSVDGVPRFLFQLASLTP